MKVKSGSSLGVVVAASLVAAMAQTAAASSAADIEHPQFEPWQHELSKDAFLEQFDDSWDKRWRVSHTKKDDEFTYRGEWGVEESLVNPGFAGDKGLVAKSEAAHHAISARLPQPFDNTNNTLVLQYEVKLQKGLDCGGAYIKLLSAEGGPDESTGTEFSNDSPYQVMFGPDKCGSSNKVHFIIKRKNPVTGEYEEKHLKTPPMARIVKTTTLYTLVIHPNQDFEVRINGEIAKAGSLLDEQYFSINPPKEIDDPEDFKPEDWVDEVKIADPSAVKPDDWDESAPFLISDPHAVIPDDWDESASEYIPDPEAQKPEFWDDEEDGEWLAPRILNPECQDHGCGPWSPPKIKNPDYKGKWSAPLIDNPDYKGTWAPRKIPNPAYYEDATPSNLEPIGALGFELWTMTDSILFDNIYLGHSVEEAETIGNSTFIPKVEIEEQVAAANAPKAEHGPEEPPSEHSTEDSLISDLFDKTIESVLAAYVSGKIFLSEFFDQPAETLMNKPGEAIFYSTVFVGTLTTAFVFSAILVSVVSSLLSSPEPTLVAGSTKTPVAPPKIEEIEEVEEEFEKIDGNLQTTSDSKKNETEAVKR